MSAIYASLTIFLLVGAISFALYVAIYGSHRPFDERITDMGVKMRRSGARRQTLPEAAR